jgi:hypothetical protein
MKDTFTINEAKELIKNQYVPFIRIYANTTDQKLEVIQLAESNNYDYDMQTYAVVTELYLKGAWDHDE